MTSAKTPTLLATLPLLAALLSACSSTPVAAPTPARSVAAAQTTAPMQPAPRTPAMPAPAPASNVATAAQAAAPDPRSDMAAGRSVYFDFDAFLVRNEFETLIVRHGKWLMANPTLTVKIEGHTDERGSHEYNLALGQRRAQAVVGALKAYGVRDTQMEAISWGKEKPKASGHDESAWAQNRRADLAYPKR